MLHQEEEQEDWKRTKQKQEFSFNLFIKFFFDMIVGVLHFMCIIVRSLFTISILIMESAL